MSNRINWGFVNLDKFNSYIGSNEAELKESLIEEYNGDRLTKELVERVIAKGEIVAKNEEERLIITELFISMLDEEGVCEDVVTDLVAEDYYDTIEDLDRSVPKHEAIDYLNVIGWGVEMGEYTEKHPPEDFPIFVVLENKDLPKWKDLMKDLLNKYKDKTKKEELTKQFLEELVDLLEVASRKRKMKDIYIWLG